VRERERERERRKKLGFFGSVQGAQQYGVTGGRDNGAQKKNHTSYFCMNSLTIVPKEDVLGGVYVLKTGGFHCIFPDLSFPGFRIYIYISRGHKVPRCTCPVL
jgi:hypothetical protein